MPSADYVCRIPPVSEWLAGGDLDGRILCGLAGGADNADFYLEILESAGYLVRGDLQPGCDLSEALGGKPCRNVHSHMRGSFRWHRSPSAPWAPPYVRPVETSPPRGPWDYGWED